MARTALPTRRGVAVLLGSAATILTGWALGMPEASAVGASGIFLLLGCATTVHLRGAGPSVQRTARPRRLRTGDPCEVALTAFNHSGTTTPVTTLIDRVGDASTAAVTLGPMRAGGSVEAMYTLPTRRRGVYRLGPLQRSVEDPFGLFRRQDAVPATTTVLVMPRTVRLDRPRATVGDEPEVGVHDMVSASTPDEEFTGLRPYVAGDDVRRIHWASTARSGAPVVRQFEVPWQHRTTVLADLRAERHDDDSFERMVVVLASLAESSARHGEHLRFWSTDEPEAGFIDASIHLEALLGRLAVLQPVRTARGEHDSLVNMVEQATRVATGRLVICTGWMDPAERARVEGAASRAGAAIVLTTRGGQAADAGSAGGPLRVHWDGSIDLVTAWRSGLAHSQGAPTT
jgi:uncharacterized protein (DUF58 family)